MNRKTIMTILAILCIAVLFSACSSSAPVSSTNTTPTPQEQTPTATVPAETQPITSAPSESINPNSTVTQSEPATANPTPAVTGVTASELALHNTKDDCWVVYKNTTYDVTKYLPKHPGGVLAISKQCGTLNFEKAFKGQHGTSKEKFLISNSVNMGEYVG